MFFRVLPILQGFQKTRFRLFFFSNGHQEGENKAEVKPAQAEEEGEQESESKAEEAKKVSEEDRPAETNEEKAEEAVGHVELGRDYRGSIHY